MTTTFSSYTRQSRFRPTTLDIVTNPPFGTQGKLALKFIERSLELTAHHHCRIAMLLPIDYDSGSTRRHVFGDCPRFYHKITLLNRVRIFNGQSGTTNHAWYLWDGHESCQLPTISYAKIIYEKPAPKR